MEDIFSVNINQHPANPHLFEEVTLPKNQIYIFKPQMINAEESTDRRILWYNTTRQNKTSVLRCCGSCETGNFNVGASGARANCHPIWGAVPLVPENSDMALSGANTSSRNGRNRTLFFSVIEPGCLNGVVMDQNSPRVVNGLKLPPKRVIKINRPVDNAPKEWHYHDDDGSERGPFSTNSLKGLIGRETLVWKEGMSEWKRAADVPELAAILVSIKPELPPSAIPEKWVWALAAVPIPVSWFLAGMVESASIVTVATIALNILFLVLDIQALKKTGRDINKVLWLGLILVPVYLFVRAAKYSKKYAPAIVWCVLFGLDVLSGTVVTDNQASTPSLFSARLSSSELASRVLDAINAEYQSKPETRGVYQVKDLSLVHDAGNMYHGLATVRVKAADLVDANGDPVDGLGSQEVKMDVNVTYDGENFIWQITPR